MAVISTRAQKFNSSIAMRRPVRPVLQVKYFVKLKLKEMKKLILIFLAAIAISCGDSTNRSSETGTDIETEDNYSTDPLESDTTDMEMDTTSTPGMDTEGEIDTTSTNP